MARAGSGQDLRQVTARAHPGHWWDIRVGWALHNGEAEPFNTSQSPETGTLTTTTQGMTSRRARGIPACLHSLWVKLAHGNGDSSKKGTQGKEDVRENCSREGDRTPSRGARVWSRRWQGAGNNILRN